MTNEMGGRMDEGKVGRRSLPIMPDNDVCGLGPDHSQNTMEETARSLQRERESLFRV